MMSLVACGDDDSGPSQVVPASQNVATIYAYNDINAASPAPVRAAGADLIRTSDRVAVSFRAQGQPMDVVNLWLLVFNDPESCTGGVGMRRCGLSDTFSTVRLSNGVISSLGYTNLSGILSEGSDLSDAEGADIIAVLTNAGQLTGATTITAQFHGGTSPTNQTFFASFQADQATDVAGGAGVDVVEVFQWDADGDGVADFTNGFDQRQQLGSSTSQLIRTADGIRFQYDVSGGMTPGDLLTIWWIVFNNPELCQDTNPVAPAGCGVDDLQTIEVVPANIWASGSVVRSDGSATLTASLPVNDTSFALSANSLESPNSAFVHLILRSHLQTVGTATGAFNQLTTPSGGCTGPCANFAFAPHDRF